MPAKKSSPNREKNPWKMVSVIFIILFIAILAWGILALRTKPEFTQLTEEQITLAEGIVSQDLESRGDDIENYEVSVTDRVVGFFERHGPGMGPWTPCRNGDCQHRRSIQVSLRGNTSGYLYIVDLDSERILMKSATEWFED